MVVDKKRPTSRTLEKEAMKKIPMMAHSENKTTSGCYV